MALYRYTKICRLVANRLLSKNRNNEMKISVRSLMSKQLFYKQFGEPLDVVKFREVDIPPLGSQDVLVRMLAAPVNPADINTIQGKYPVKVELPVIAGNEGVGLVEEVGSDVKDVKPGNKVIFSKPQQGTWRDIAVVKKDYLMVVPDNLGLVEAATLTVNPCTAYRMLLDFKNVKDGLVVIQNGANSACGQNVIQICKAWGIPNVNIVRDRPDIDALKSYLTELGATYVLTEEESRSTTIFKDKKIDKPSLALNCVGGKNATNMLRHLQHSGKFVTYGGMSREPVSVPTASFIFKNLSFHGFWMTSWNQNADPSVKSIMMNDLIELMCQGKLKGPVHKMVKFSNYEEAVGNALSSKGFTGCLIVPKPPLPRVPGDEGVGEIVEVGSQVHRVQPGHRVIVTKPLLGTWTYYGKFDEHDVYKVPSNIDLPELAMLSRAPCTAYRLLTDIVKLCPTDTVIQNGAQSPVGQSVIQLCKHWNIKTINIVSSHYGYETLKKHLLDLGATKVYTLEEVEELDTFLTSLKRPKLALNSLSGRYERVLLKILERYGTMVNHGGAFKNPTGIPKRLRPDVCIYNFSIDEWNATTHCMYRDKMIKDILQIMVIGKFRAPLFEVVELKSYIDAFRNTISNEGFSTVNYIFDFTKP